jgi:hypothetical protein
MKFILPFCLLSLSSFAETTTITDLKGRSLKVELVKLEGSQLSFKKAGKSTIMSVSLEKLSKASAESVRKKMSEIQADAAKNPPLEVKVVIKKNDRRMGDSSYMKRMAIEATVGLQNKNLNIDAEECICTSIIIGEDQKVRDKYKVLGKQQFKLTPDHKMAEFTTKPVYTEYDSDNQGYGNIGGYKYDGYILIVQNSDKDVIEHKTNISRLKNDFSEEHSKKLIKIKEGAMLDRDMTPLH